MLLERERTTSAEGAMRRVRPASDLPLYFGSFTLSTVVTSTGQSDYPVLCDTGTRADPACPVSGPVSTPSRDILEIRFISGLTWDELAEVFGVSRRSVHNWANGEALRADNIFLVGHVLQAIRQLRRPSSAETRLALLFPLPGGQRPLDYLRRRRWQEAIIAVRSLPPLPVPPSPTDPDQPHPTAYFGALNDRPAPTSGKIFRGRARRIPRRSA